MTRGNCDKMGSGRKSMRLLFYFTAVFTVCGIIAFMIYSCWSESHDRGKKDTEKIIFVLNNGETDIVCEIEDEIPRPSKSGYYLYGWYADEELTERIEFETLADVIGEANANKFTKGEYKLYAEWRELRTMTGVRMKDTFLIYDGKRHEPEIEGLPDGAEVEYLGEEGYKDAGEYEVEAIVRAYGYYDLKIGGKLTIRKAKVDMTGIRFESKTVKWDGSEKRIEIEGELPEGVSVRYENNGKKDIGEYEVIAKFDSGKNYESIGDMKATLTILAEGYEITLIEEDGTKRVITVRYGTVAEIPKPKEKRGYIGKWSIEDIENIREDVTAYAVYEKERYKIVYEANGGNVAEDSATEYTVEDAVWLKDAVREHYEFGGWYESENCTGEKVKEIPLDSIGNRKYYAKWIAKEYTVEYELDGGQNNAHNVNRDNTVYVYTVNYDDLTLWEPTKKGYRFVRWKDKSGEEVKVISASNPSNYTVYAEWEEIRYSISYELNGGENSESNPDSYTVGSGEIVLANPSREKYAFLGWYEDAEYGGNKIEKISGTECRDIRLYAKWERKAFTVDLIDGKNVITGYEYELGADVVIPKEVDGKRIEGIASGVLVNAKSVEIEGMEEINPDAFEGCERLRELKLPSTLKRMPNGLLADCKGIEKLTVPYASDKKIGSVNGEYYPLSELFGRSAREGYYEVEVRTANITKEEEDIVVVRKEYRCYVPSSLEEITVMGGDVAPYALYGLTSVKRMRILGDCGSIGMKGMAGCTGLESVVLGEWITSVKKNALDDCGNLKEIYIPETYNEAILSELLSALQKQGIPVNVVKYKVDFLTVYD